MSLDPKDSRPARDAHSRRRRRARFRTQAAANAHADASRHGVGEIEIRPHTGSPLRREGDASAGLAHPSGTRTACADRNGTSTRARARDSGARDIASHSSADGDGSAAALTDSICDRCPKSRRDDPCASTAIDRNRTADVCDAADGRPDRGGVALSRPHGHRAEAVASTELHALHAPEAVAASELHALHAAAHSGGPGRAPVPDAQARRVLRGCGVSARGHLHADARQEEAVERSRIWRCFESVFAKSFASARLSRTATGSVCRKSSPSTATRRARDFSPPTSGA
jgi:hypothetical protein